MSDDIKCRLITALPRHLVLDLLDMAVARTLKAHELVRDGTDLSGRGARALEGQARFRLMEKGFQVVCEQHGAVALEGGVIPNTDLRFFQPFMRFGGSEAGVVLGFASMPARHEMPVKNQSRAAGVSLNYHLTPRLDLDDQGPKPGDIFVLFLVARDPGRAGKIEEVAVGVIDAEYAGYLFYEPVETFVAGYATPTEVTDADARPELVRLKTKRKQFKPPEVPDPKDKAGGDA
jgi:hypothetical protein